MDDRLATVTPSRQLSFQEDSLCLLPAVVLAEQIRRRQISPVDVVDSYLARIERRNATTNAYVHIMAEQARAVAKQREQELSHGRVRGSLHGVPIAVKDLFDFVDGEPNTFGVRQLADYVPDFTSAHVLRLECEGAIVLGKTNTPEFGHKATTDNRLFGPTSTPFGPGKNAGGSSGGSAAAVADCLCALAQGSDGGGSVRIPAALCGAVGMKPTYGRLAAVVRPDAFFTLAPFMSNGPIARTVEDCALMLDSMVGADSRDPMSVGHDGVRFRDAVLQRPENLRIAYLPTLGGFPVDSAVRLIIDDAVNELARAGVHVEQPEFRLPAPHQEITDLWVRLAGSSLVSVIETFARGGLDLRADRWVELPPHLRLAAERGYRQQATSARMDQLLRTAIFDALTDVLTTYDLIISPTVAVLPFDNFADGWTVGPDSINGEDIDPTLGWCLTHPFNFSGHPAISVPGGFTEDGLPVGLQIAGRRFADDVVLAVAATFERLRPWYDRYLGLTLPSREVPTG